MTATINGIANQSYSNYSAEVGTLTAGTFTSRKTLDFSTVFVVSEDNDIRITALDSTLADDNVYATLDIALTVNEIAPTTITLNTETASALPGGTYQLSVKSVSPYYAAKDVTWSSANTGIATVDSNGLVSDVAGGTTTITATSVKDVSIKATCSFTVKVIGPEATFTAATLGLVSSSYANNDIEHEDSEAIYKIKTSDVMLNSSNIQVRRSPQGKIWNVTSWTEDIGKIILTQASGKEIADNEFTVFYGDSANPVAAANSLTSSLATSDSAINYDISAKGSFKFFTIQGSSSNTAYLSSIYVISTQEEVRQFVSQFNEALDATCNDTAPSAITSATWTTLSTSYASLSTGAKALLKNVAVETETDVATKKAISRYDYVMTKTAYSAFADFIGRFPSRDASGVNELTKSSSPENVLYITLGIGLVAAGSFYIFSRKKKEA